MAIDEITVNNQKIMRDEYGRFLKGTPCPNGGGGRPVGTTDELSFSGFKKRLAELVGTDHREIALKLAEIAFYEQNDYKDKWPKYKADHKLKAIELILKYTQELPAQQINANVNMKTININLTLPAEFSNEDF